MSFFFALTRAKLLEAKLPLYSLVVQIRQFLLLKGGKNPRNTPIHKRKSLHMSREEHAFLFIIIQLVLV